MMEMIEKEILSFDGKLKHLLTHYQTLSQSAQDLEIENRVLLEENQALKEELQRLKTNFEGEIARCNTEIAKFVRMIDQVLGAQQAENQGSALHSDRPAEGTQNQYNNYPNY